jgi:TRAP-type C4-dicarboxylate transport system substrate-binding protein
VSCIKSGLIALAIAQCYAVAALGEPATKPIDLTLATVHTVNLPFVRELERFFVPEFNRRVRLQTGADRYHWIEVYGGALSKWHNSLETVAIGLTDFGWVGTLWEPAKMPLQNITYYLPFITDDLGVLLRTFNQIHAELPAAGQSWINQNQVYLAATGIETYHLLTNFPVRVLEDLRGRKILAPGASAVWLRGTGAVPVNGALTTYYTQLKTGVAEGTLTILTGAHPYKIHEVAPYITLIGIGAQFAGALSVNLDTWKRFSRAEQTLLRELANEYTDVSVAAVRRRYADALATMVAEGAIVTTLPPSEKQKWIDGLPEYGKAWVERNEAKGLPAKEMLDLLMNGIRAAGLEPQRDWDHYE